MAIKKKLGKLSRREGIPLSPSVSIAKVMQRRPYGPGMHGPKQTRKRVSTYGLQLREKQKAKLLYDLREKQFRNYYKKAIRTDGDTGVILIRLLELRLENVVLKMGFAKTRQQARQLVSHKYFTVNGIPVNIRSYKVKSGDIVAFKDTKKDKKIMPDLLVHAETVTVPSWLSVDVKKGSGQVLSEPEGDDLNQPFDPTLIIEFYSR
ncbi:30S ribosomal protein S4 [Candidatus Uhrbacteria bacterium CG10_big_fil_rev_8_21_14_0_10_50_16]|uniref:Small ribosomal subunit protein uS4 n=1 Tax=Candidatus Uhrbacteria bacterium CG10_big_fil_rev_8_21_14_0_10_50_16 TaxID=1975039 RepID=A0A2H0RNA7_9BACT|nr:MAG: 30S ribosomal protein S4 [Candidatus Uhrbacteria bacterium CG10_big_fil_rev_8_21_14_0_10_50_16]